MRIAALLVLATATPAGADQILAREGDQLVAVDHDGKQRRELDVGVRILDASLGPDGTLLVEDYDENLYQVGKDGKARDIGRGSDVVFAPGGKRIAFGCEPDANHDSVALCVAAVDGSDRRLLHTGMPRVEPRGFSADGARVFFAVSAGEGETLYATPTAGGEARALFRATSRGALSPDGRRYAWAGAGTLHIRPVEGGPEKTIPIANLANGSCAWSPDSARLASVLVRQRPGRPESSSVEVLEVARGAVHVLASHGNGRPIWSPDGERIVYQFADKDDSWPAVVTGWKGGANVTLPLRLGYEDRVLSWGR
jgi:Tol biopolymer transport system component